MSAHDDYLDPDIHLWPDEEPESDEPKLTPAQQERHKALSERVRHWYNNYQRKTTTLDKVLEWLPEGDFHWDDAEAGEPHVYCCGERDCPVQWHLAFYTTEFKRENGMLEITMHSGDEDGNWNVDEVWESGDQWEGSGVADHLGEGNLNDYFKGWAEYWLDAAVTGLDPCNQLIKPIAPGKWVDFCLNAAEDNVKHLML